MKHENLVENQKGMALLEGLIAILIFSLGVLSIVGLQAANLRQSTDAKYRLDASFLANQTLGRMWTDKSNLASYAVTDEVLAGLPNGMRTVTVEGKQVTVLVTWQMPGETVTHRHVVVTEISE